jgi:hypothetical protein
MAKGDWAGDGFWKGEAKGTAEAAPAIVAAFLAKAFELQRASFLWAEAEDAVFHFWGNSDGVQINTCEFRMSFDEATQFFAEHSGHKRLW